MRKSSARSVCGSELFFLVVSVFSPFLSLCGPVEFEAQEAEKQQQIQKVMQEQERKKKEEQEWRLRQVCVLSVCVLSVFVSFLFVSFLFVPFLFFFLFC